MNYLLSRKGWAPPTSQLQYLCVSSSGTAQDISHISKKGSSFHLHNDVQPSGAVWKRSYLLCEDPDKLMIVRAARSVNKTFTSWSSNPTPALSKSRLPILFRHRWVKNCHSYGQECEYCAERKMRSFVTIDGHMGNNTAQMNASTLHPNVKCDPVLSLQGMNANMYFFDTI